jgi:hypothetical protein
MNYLIDSSWILGFFGWSLLFLTWFAFGCPSYQHSLCCLWKPQFFLAFGKPEGFFPLHPCCWLFWFFFGWALIFPTQLAFGHSYCELYATLCNIQLYATYATIHLCNYATMQLYASLCNYGTYATYETMQFMQL